MLKHIITSLFAVVLAANAFAQALTLEQKRKLFEQTDKLLATYQSAGEFRELGVTGTSPAMAEKFRSIFYPATIVYDGLSPKRDEMGQPLQPLATEYKALDKFISDLMQNFPSGISMNITKSNISFENINSSDIRVVMERSLSGKTRDDLSMKTTDTVELTLAVNAAKTDVQIKSMTKLGYSISCLNCKPAVAVKDKTKEKEQAALAEKEKQKQREKELAEAAAKKEREQAALAEKERKEKETLAAKTEKEKEQAALAEKEKREREQAAMSEKEKQAAAQQREKEQAEATERDRKAKEEQAALAQKEKEKNTTVVISEPEKEKEKKPLAYEFAMAINLGGVLGSVKHDALNLSQLNTSVYSDVIAGKSNIGGYKTSGIAPGFSAGLDLELMFGKRNQIGLGVGFLYQQMSYKISLDEFKVSYGAHDSLQTTYNRIVTARDVSEKVSASSVSVPVLIRYRGKIGDKVSVHIGLGPVLMLSNTQTSKGSATADFEAIYNWDATTHEFGFDPSGEVSAQDWLLTASAVANHTEAAAYFETHNNAGYDIALDAAKTKTNKTKFGFALGGMLRAGVGISLSKRAEFLIGVSMLYAQLKKDETKYVMFDKSTDDYHSMLDAVQKQTQFAFGLNLGVRFALASANQ